MRTPKIPTFGATVATKPAHPYDGRFPFFEDRKQIVDFLMGVGSPPTGESTVISVASAVIEDKNPNGPVLCISRRDGSGRAVRGSQKGWHRGGAAVHPIASYEADGSIMLHLPEDPIARAYARQALNHMLEVLGEPNERRVEQVWAKSVPAAHVPTAAEWPVEAWTFEGATMEVGVPYQVCGRLTLAAWRSSQSHAATSGGACGEQGKPANE